VDRHEQTQCRGTGIDFSQSFELTTPTDLGLVCFNLKNAPEKNTERFMTHLQSMPEDGAAFLVYPSQWQGMPFVRIALAGVNTSLNDVKTFWQLCEAWQAR